MGSCRQEFVNQGCMCLADPMDPYTTVCGYINRQNGLVYPCDMGCCVPKCDHMGHAPRVGVEFRKSSGTDLPEGFNVNLPQSDEPSEVPGATPVPPPPAPPAPRPRDQIVLVPEWLGLDEKVWQVLCKLLLILLVCLALFFSIF